MAEASTSGDEVYFNRLPLAVRTVAKKCLLYILRSQVDQAQFLHTYNQHDKVYLRARLTATDRNLIQEATTNGTTNYERFDHTLLYKILRNLGTLDAPRKGWGKKPGKDDTSKAADIERLRLIRNTVYHESETDYTEMWQDLHCVCKRMDDCFPGASFEADLKALDKPVTRSGIHTGIVVHRSNQGTSGYSELLDSKIPKPPGKPVEDGATASSITITWLHEEASDVVVGYEVWYSTAITWRMEWKMLYTKGRNHSLRVENLCANTEYVFKVRAHYQTGTEESESAFGAESEIITTKETPAVKLIHLGGVALHRDRQREVALQEWNLNFEDQVLEDFLLVRKFVPGGAVPTSSVAVSRTIMFIGASGCGKTTLINAIINYMYDVSFDDYFRLTIGQPTPEMMPQGRRLITKYILPCLQGSRFKFSLNVIDVPGFTCDSDQDGEITRLVERYFDLCRRGSIDFLDCLGYVTTQAHLFSPLVEPDYIQQRIKSFLGWDLAKILQIFITSSDPSFPMSSSVLRKIEELNPACRNFKFNNVGLWCSEEEMARNYWKMGVKSFQHLADELRMGSCATFGQSSEILVKKNFLNHLFWSSEPFLETLVNRIVGLQEDCRMARNMKDRNIHTDLVLEIDRQELSLNQHHILWAYNCAHCQFTCLSQSHDRTDSVSVVDNISGKCLMCGCNAGNHQLEKKFYFFRLRKVAKSAEEILTKYGSNDVRDVIHTIEQLRHQREKEMKNVLYLAERNIQLLIQKLAKCSIVHVKDAIDFLIQVEKFENPLGSHHRIRVYENMKRYE